MPPDAHREPRPHCSELLALAGAFLLTSDTRAMRAQTQRRSQRAAYTHAICGLLLVAYCSSEICAIGAQQLEQNESSSSTSSFGNFNVSSSGSVSPYPPVAGPGTTSVRMSSTAHIIASNVLNIVCGLLVVWGTRMLPMRALTKLVDKLYGFSGALAVRRSHADRRLAQNRTRTERRKEKAHSEPETPSASPAATIAALSASRATRASDTLLLAVPAPGPAQGPASPRADETEASVELAAKMDGSGAKAAAVHVADPSSSSSSSPSTAVDISAADADESEAEAEAESEVASPSSSSALFTERLVSEVWIMGELVDLSDSRPSSVWSVCSDCCSCCCCCRSAPSASASLPDSDGAPPSASSFPPFPPAPLGASIRRLLKLMLAMSMMVCMVYLQTMFSFSDAQIFDQPLKDDHTQTCSADISNNGKADCFGQSRQRPQATHLHTAVSCGWSEYVLSRLCVCCVQINLLAPSTAIWALTCLLAPLKCIATNCRSPRC